MMTLNKVNYRIDPQTVTKEEMSFKLPDWKIFQTEDNPNFDDSLAYFVVFKDGYMMIDFDFKERTDNDLQRVKDILDKYGIDSAGFIVESGRQGYHAYLQVVSPKNNVETFRNTAGKHEYPELYIDSRANGGLAYGSGTKFSNTARYHDVQGDESMIPEVEGWRVAWITGHLEVQACGISIPRFLNGEIDVHGNGVMKKRENEWLVWANTMRELKKLGYSKSECAIVFQSIPGHDAKKTASQLNSYWDHPEKIKVRASEGGKVKENGKVKEKVSVIDNYYWVVTGQEFGFWVKSKDNIDSWYDNGKKIKIELEKLMSQRGLKTPLVKLMKAHKLAHYMSIDDIFPDKNIIHYKDMIYFISEDECLPRNSTDIPKHLRKYNFKTFGVISHDYPNEPAECPKYDKLLSDVIRPEQIEDNWEFLGYIPLNHVEYKKAIFYIGKTNSGKSTLGEIQAVLYGEENKSERSFQELCYDRFATASLEGKYINYDDDMSAVEIKHGTAKFKKLTGHNTMPVQRKGQDEYDTKNITKCIFAANGKNELPVVKPLSDAFCERVAPFPCDNDFTKSGIPKKDIQDSILNDPGEVKGIVYKAHQAMLRLVKRGYFDTMSIKEVKHIWLMESNPYYKFIQECCIKGPKYSTKNNDLYDAFEEWSDINGITFTKSTEIKSVKGFTSRLRQIGTFCTVHSDGSRYYDKIKLKDDNTPEKTEGGLDRFKDIEIEVDDKGMSFDEAIQEQKTKNGWDIKARKVE